MSVQDHVNLQQIMQTPNVLGCVCCSPEGDVLAREGSEQDSLAMVLGHFVRLSKSLGASFGNGDFHQAHVQGKAVNVLCLPVEDGAIGVALDARARVPEVALCIKRLVNGA